MLESKQAFQVGLKMCLYLRFIPTLSFAFVISIQLVTMYKQCAGD